MAVGTLGLVSWAQQARTLPIAPTMGLALAPLLPPTRQFTARTASAHGQWR